MINIKGMAIATDGSFKRIAITYDEIDETGKVINSNAKINRVVTDETVLDAITIIDNYAKTVVDAQ
jgi:hypothetical protein